MSYKRFEDLPLWQQARKLVSTIYKNCHKDSFNHDYSLVDQIRRASVSIMLNLAEGFEKRSNKEFAKFVNTAKASAGEVRSAIYIASDLGYINEELFDDLMKELISISNQLSKFEKYLLETYRK